MNELLSTFLIALGLQAIFFAVAATFKTDKVTDLSYGLTFVIVALFLFWRHQTPYAGLLAAMITLWGIRLASYLFIRILKMGRDRRFDGIREKFWAFAKFWLLQGIAIWVIMLPAIFGMRAGQTISPVSYVGLAIFLLGLLIETFADWQKYQFKNDPKNRGKWIASGIWKHARHPNYFGELLVWWGIFLYVVPTLQGWGWLTVISPLFITVLLLFVTGIPPLRKQMDEKYGKNPKYQSYLKKTRLLVPIPKFSSKS